jgi:predicted AlkP superfamily phosphohydrolase/phosphomutase
MTSGKTKVLVVGLDCAGPELVFDKFKDELPNLSAMIDNGIYGELESCHPPITIPAWAVMFTGKSPGKLGLYGFRHRKGNSYTDFYIATSHFVKEPTVWDLASKYGKKACVVGVPPSYPPKPLNGHLISCFITPDTAKEYTYPSNLKHEVEQLVGRYVFDVEFRTEEREKLLRELYDMTEKRFKVLKYLVAEKPWDLFIFVEIGVDRVHHAFWKFFDKEHHKYVAGNEFEDVIPNYYKFLDERIGELIKLAGQDAIVMVVSDHGVKRMKGAFCVNEWLAEEGLLKFKRKPDSVLDLEKTSVDWAETKVWGWGGYYARIFLNVKGREPEGVIPQESYESFRYELIDRLRNITDPEGHRMDMKVFKPEEIYPVLNGDPPDLMVYFDDLYWRSAGTVGHGTIYLPENDKGPDDAMHSMHGIFILYDEAERFSKAKVNGLRLSDVAPTILSLLGLQSPPDIEGRAVVSLGG